MFLKSLICFFPWLTLAAAAKTSQAKPGCQDTCGNVSIPYPFGVGEPHCYQQSGLQLVCNESYNPPRLLYSNIPLVSISLSNGTMTVGLGVSYYCYDQAGQLSYGQTWTFTLNENYYFSDTRNKFTTIGCDTNAIMSDSSVAIFKSGCMSVCANERSIVEGSCSGIGCCQTAIPKGLKTLNVSLSSFYNHNYSWAYNPCSYAFFADSEQFNFSRSDLLNFTGMGPEIGNDISFPAVLDWVVGVETCEEAKRNLTNYACGSNSTCDDSTNGPGYNCLCNPGYEGNPYLIDGCQETARALAYLHSAPSRPIIHRDVKSANILLDDNFTAKVADFGISKLVQLDQTQMSTLVQGTLGYLDPEYYHTSQLTEKSDVFSFGVVLVELLTGEKPICSKRSQEERSLATYFPASLKENRLFQLVEPQIINEGKSAQIIAYSELAKRCLNWKSEKRPTMKEIAMELERLKRFQIHPWTPQQRNEESTSLLSEPSDLYSVELTSYTGNASGQYSMEVMLMNVPPR
ncbi:hypothetical protein GIB67_033790 [Kingdonia uniflora]|uniref:Uncharacterized protein n=1 Tax=Kingdonia uniflora TaxID=39325 RepID=A0A7J7P504_9MAGN|nr:hypothetical protein GIB67_033790 [Kingdonia uniflora]